MLKNFKISLCFYFVSQLLLISSNNIFSQSETVGGLLFEDHFNSILKLSENEKFSFSKTLELSFDFSLNLNKHSGNIIFIGDGKFFTTYLELINYRNIDTSYLSLFVNQKETSIVFPLAKHNLNLREWLNFVIKLDKLSQSISITYKGKTHTISASIPRDSELVIIFGELPVWKYLTGLNASYFALKNVKIKINSKLEHYWTLDEIAGDYAYDSYGFRRSKQEKCKWLKSSAIKWKEIARLKSDAKPGIAFDPKTNNLLVVNRHNLIKFNTISGKTEKIDYVVKRPRTADVAFFSNYKNKLLAYYRGLGEISVYNERNRSWSKIDMSRDTLSEYYANTTFADPRNGDLYALGGYGWYTTKNHLLKYNFMEKKWEIIKTKGDYLTPRANSYISQGFTDYEFYIFGGTGNESGKQEEGFKPIKDLYLLNLKSYSIKKLWTNNENILALPFAQYSGNLILNKEKRELYTILINNLDNVKRLSSAKLNVISIDSALIKELSFPISNEKELWNFHLFKDDSTTQLILAVTQSDFKNTEKGKVIVYALAYPPLSSKELENQQIKKENRYRSHTSGNLFFTKYIIFTLTILGIGLIWLLIKKKYIDRNKNSRINNTSNSGIFYSVNKNYISILGKFLIIDKTGIEITNKFNPKVKELFLFILLKTINNYNSNSTGITTSLITNNLWPDFLVDEAKNIRGVTIHRLRELLEKLDKIELVYKDKIWHLLFFPPLIIDYKEYLKFSSEISSKDITLENINYFIGMVKNGGLLPDLSYNWLDSIKYSINSKIITDCERMIEYSSEENNNELIVELSDVILRIDAVYESALSAKINALSNLGRFGYMKETYDLFYKEYHNLYGKTYSKTLDDILITKN